MNIDVQLIEKVVKKVLTDVECAGPADDYTYGIFAVSYTHLTLPTTPYV